MSPRRKLVHSSSRHGTSPDFRNVAFPAVPGAAAPPTLCSCEFFPGAAASEPEAASSSAAILQTLHDAVKAGHAEAVWAALQALPDTVSKHDRGVSPAADTLGAAIDMATAYAASSSHSSDTTLRRLATISVNCRLARHRSLEPLLEDFAMMVQIRRPAFAKAHLGEAYERAGRSLQASCRRRRLDGTPIDPMAVLHDAFVRLLAKKELLRSWEFPEDAELQNFLRQRVDNEGRSRQRRHFTHRRICCRLERPEENDGEQELLALDYADCTQSALQETIVVAEDLLEHLERLERTAKEMHDDGFRNVEIARECGIHRKTVAVHLERGEQKLRALYEGGWLGL